MTSLNYKRELDSHMIKNTEWGAVAYLSHSKYGIDGSIRINNNSSYKTGYAAINEATCGYTTTNDDFKKYYDEYSSTSSSNYTNPILGDATGEMGSLLV